jgi:hypothetical protein
VPKLERQLAPTDSTLAYCPHAAATRAFGITAAVLAEAAA